jgi:hypothetical protein
MVYRCFNTVEESELDTQIHVSTYFLKVFRASGLSVTQRPTTINSQRPSGSTSPMSCSNLFYLFIDGESIHWHDLTKKLPVKDWDEDGSERFDQGTANRNTLNPSEFMHFISSTS